MQTDSAAAHSAPEENQDAATTVKFIFAGIVFIINGFLADWILGAESRVGDFSAMIGAIILGVRIFRTPLRD